MKKYVIMMIGDNMKRLNNKGFTLVEILGTVAILGILTGIAIQAYSRYISSSRNKAYQFMVQSAETAMENYVMEYPSVTSATFQELNEKGYLKLTKDPTNSSKVCKGKVTLETGSGDVNGVSLNSYTTSICCINYNYTYHNNHKTKAKDTTCQVS